MPLTDTSCKNAKPRGADYKLADGGGLYLLVKRNGSRYWRLKYRYGGKEKVLAIGVYPLVALVAARQARDDAKRKLQLDQDPGQVKRIERRQKTAASALTFEVVAREWHHTQLAKWQPRTAHNYIYRLERDVFPLIGAHPIAGLKAPVLLDVLRQIEKRGAHEMARRVGQVCSQVFRYAIASGYAESDPIPSLRGALKPVAKGHHAAITADDLPDFLKAFEAIKGRMYVPTRVMFQLMMLTFVRTSELTETPWSEIDLEKEVWVIPWRRMKMGKKKVNPRKVSHHVFLPKQGWELLRALHEVTGGNEWLFPNLRQPSQPATNFGILAALKRMGYSGKMTGHGFRSLAMGVIKERLGYRHEVVDRQLSHMSGDVYGEAYDRALFLDERREMMQRYADYLANLAF